jgi:glucose-6-phosphate-specific signal transduction histidine kinase
MLNPRGYIIVFSASGYALAAALILYVWSVYAELPEMVAVDFGPGGQPVIGPKEVLLRPLALMIGVGIATAAIITAIIVFRHTIVERYPYLISLPALTLVLGKIADKEVRRQYIDRLFVIVALAQVLVLVIITVIAISVLESARTFHFDATLTLGLTLVLTGGFIAVVLLYYRSIYREIRAKVVT